MGNLEKEIFKVLHYFQFFDYPPSFEEIYTFLPKKTSRQSLKKALEDLERHKKIISQKVQCISFSNRAKMYIRYTLGEYGIKIQNSKFKSQNDNLKLKVRDQFDDFQKRYLISENKLKNWRFRVYIKLLSFFPQIKLVGLSGSMAMMNAGGQDDIDLFIITAKNRLFTGRFIALILAQLLGIRRKREEKTHFRILQAGSPEILPQLNSSARGGLKHPVSENFGSPAFFYLKDKVCLNLFFDEVDLAVPDLKKTEYVAHEVLQMRPLITKGDIYQRFLRANRWVYDFFPNAEEVSLKLKIKNQKLQSKVKNHFKNFKFLTVIFNFSFLTFNLFADKIENLLKRFQLYFINRHRTTEIITNHQLWFHPEDFGKKLRESTRIRKRINTIFRLSQQSKRNSAGEKYGTIG